MLMSRSSGPYLALRCPTWHLLTSYHVPNPLSPKVPMRTSVSAVLLLFASRQPGRHATYIASIVLVGINNVITRPTVVDWPTDQFFKI